MRKRRQAAIYLVSVLIIIAAAIIIYRPVRRNPYIINNGVTAFLCESIGTSDLTDDFRIASVYEGDIEKEYSLWKKQNKLSCNNIDRVDILE